MFRSTHVRFAPDVILQVVEDEALLLKLDSEDVFSLNDTGARIAQLIAAGHPTETMADLLRREYDLEREILERDVLTLIEALRSEGLIVDVGAEPQ